MRRVLVLAIVVGTAVRADAFAPRKGEPGVVVTGARTTRAVDADPPTVAARSRFAALAAAGWRASWDHDTGVPVWLWGSFVAAPGAVRDPAIAERAARAFLAAHLDVLAPGASTADFVVAANQLDGELRTVGLFQTAGGLRVVGGQLGFVFAHDRLFAVSSAALPDVRFLAPRGSLPASVVRARGEAWLAAETGATVTTRAIRDRVILPIVHAGARGISYHVVDVLDIDARGAPGRWDVFVDADGTPLARRSRILFATGTLVYNAGVRYATGARADAPAPTAHIVVDSVATQTAADGSFSWTGNAQATVVPGLLGAVANIVNRAGATATASLTADPGQPVAWNLASDEYGDAQLSTYIYANAVKARALVINPSLATWLNQPLDFNVNESGVCNAYSTGDDVHFFRKSSQCENTGRMADVVYHEFGHSQHNHTVIPGMGMFVPGSLAEGLADFNAALITEDSGVGRGFFFTDVALRDIDPPGIEKKWPDDDNADPHLGGLIIAGALWDMRRALIAELDHDAGVAQSEKIFVGIMQRAPDMPSSYMAALLADDDDADLGNNTPHYCAIKRAFGVHGLVAGDFPDTTIGAPMIEGLTMSIAVDTPVTTECPPPHVASIKVTWKVGDGVERTFQLAPQGAVWTGSFPDQPDNTVVLYRIEIAMDDTSSVVLPNNPADPMYQLFVGPSVPVYCEPFDADPHWVQGSNNLGNEWEWQRPGRNPTSGDPSIAFTGDNVWGTDIIGDGEYRGNEITFAETPEVDISGFVGAHLQYRRWLTVEDAMYDQATIEVNGTKLWGNATNLGASLDHIDKEWRFHDVDLTPLIAAGTVKVRWTLTTDASKQLGGWTLDDVCIVGIPKIAACGDGVLDPGELCDDGNSFDGDGCSKSCIEEFTAGGGGCCSAESHPGSIVLGLGVLAVLRRRRRAAATSA